MPEPPRVGRVIAQDHWTGREQTDPPVASMCMGADGSAEGSPAPAKAALVTGTPVPDHDASASAARDRADAVAAAVEECVHRRATGETLSDEQVVAEHPDLAPELQEE